MLHPDRSCKPDRHRLKDKCGTFEFNLQFTEYVLNGMILTIFFRRIYFPLLQMYHTPKRGTQPKKGGGGVTNARYERKNHPKGGNTNHLERVLPQIN